MSDHGHRATQGEGCRRFGSIGVALNCGQAFAGHAADFDAAWDQLEQAEALAAERDQLHRAILDTLDDPRSLDPEGCRKPFLDRIAEAAGIV